MGEPVAALPMYDWPEVRASTDAFWICLRAALEARGIAAPARLTRGADHWRNPGLVLGQTCGLPYRRGLHAAVTLIGAPDYGLEGCPPGRYRSALVVRADDPRECPRDFVEARYACNSNCSQSGHAALNEALGPLAPARGLLTGAHRASVIAVAQARADIAAIDAVSWRLARAWEPAAARLRVLGWTRPGPGLPMITAGGRDPAPFAGAIGDAIAALAPSHRAALGLAGFVRLRPVDYGVA
jgi:ABC-type phosphate/phosphonate transport system substrate-binding protein